jgi:hypothetical protein
MAQETRNYLFKLQSGQETVKAYDLNEALVQLNIKYKGNVEILEVIPFKIEEAKTEQSGSVKQVHVKPVRN